MYTNPSAKYSGNITEWATTMGSYKNMWELVDATPCILQVCLPENDRFEYVPIYNLTPVTGQTYSWWIPPNPIDNDDYIQNPTPVFIDYIYKYYE